MYRHGQRLGRLTAPGPAIPVEFAADPYTDVAIGCGVRLGNRPEIADIGSGLLVGRGHAHESPADDVMSVANRGRPLDRRPVERDQARDEVRRLVRRHRGVDRLDPHTLDGYEWR